MERDICGKAITMMSDGVQTQAIAPRQQSGVGKFVPPTATGTL